MATGDQILSPPVSLTHRFLSLAQAFLSNIGLGSVTTNYSINSSAATGREGVSGAPYASAAGITSGSLYRGGGRVLGTAASNRAHQSLEMGETGWSREGTSGVSRHTEL